MSYYSRYTKIKIARIPARIELRRWHIVFRLRPNFDQWDGRVFEIGFFKLHTIPAPGDMLQPKHYKGFRWQWKIWYPEFGSAWNLPTKQELKEKWDDFKCRAIEKIVDILVGDPPED